MIHYRLSITSAITSRQAASVDFFANFRSTYFQIKRAPSNYGISLIASRSASKRPYASRTSKSFLQYMCKLIMMLCCIVLLMIRKQVVPLQEMSFVQYTCLQNYRLNQNSKNIPSFSILYHFQMADAVRIKVKVNTALNPTLNAKLPPRVLQASGFLFMKTLLLGGRLLFPKKEFIVMYSSVL